jgi:hypothetical protein
LGSPVSSTNKTDRNDITDIVLKVALSTIVLTQYNGPDGMGVQKEHVLLVHSASAGCNLTTLLVIGADCTDSCKSNYNTNTTSTSP